MPHLTCRDLKAGAWRAVRLAWLEDGLHVSLDGAPLVGGVEAGGYHVADFRPQPGWRLALSAHGGHPRGAGGCAGCGCSPTQTPTAARCPFTSRSTASSLTCARLQPRVSCLHP